MKKSILFFWILLSLCVSCSQDDDVSTNSACDVIEPIINVDWLSDQADAFDKMMGPQKQKITQYRFRSQDAFLIEDCIGCSDALSILKDCDGITICEFGGIDGRNTCTDFESNAILIDVLYDK